MPTTRWLRERQETGGETCSDHRWFSSISLSQMELWLIERVRETSPTRIEKFRYEGLRQQKIRNTILKAQHGPTCMPEYLIDARSMATFLVTASSQEEAIIEVKKLTYGLDLELQVGRKGSVVLVDVSCCDVDPEVIEVRDDDLDELVDDSEY